MNSTELVLNTLRTVKWTTHSVLAISTGLKMSHLGQKWNLDGRTLMTTLQYRSLNTPSLT